jgi:hypothetical protein
MMDGTGGGGGWGVCGVGEGGGGRKGKELHKHAMHESEMYRQTKSGQPSLYPSL